MGCACGAYQIYHLPANSNRAHRAAAFALALRCRDAGNQIWKGPYLSEIMSETAAR